MINTGILVVLLEKVVLKCSAEGFAGLPKGLAPKPGIAYDG